VDRLGRESNERAGRSARDEGMSARDEGRAADDVFGEFRVGREDE
jgi:hypothetical protein